MVSAQALILLLIILLVVCLAVVGIVKYVTESMLRSVGVLVAVVVGLIAALSVLGVNISAFFRNNARPDVVVGLKGTSWEDAKAFEAKWLEKFQV